LRRGQVERGELPPDFPLPYFPWPELQASFNHPSAGSEPALSPPKGHRRKCLALEAWEAGEDRHLAFNPPPAYGGRLAPALQEIKDMLAQGHRLLIVSPQASRLSELLLERDVIAPPLKGVTSSPAPGSLSLLQGSLAEGWAMGLPSSPLTLLTDTELFGFTKTRRGARRHFGRKEALLSDLAAGDYVVHIEHGIGRFLGMTRLSQDGVEREYLLLEYDAGDKLYVPSDQVDRVSRYVGPGGYVPSLSRLGGGEWARAKARVRESAAKLAQELLALYSAREVVPGFAFSRDAPWQLEMEASFPYVETPDQLEAIQEVKADMERPQPMDRLVCGDVGYGKTEVALRAAFKAVMAGKQVAVLVPTTVLAQQHLAT
ncbi:MAG: CarD family transcriptional regulator, partial [Chloroflexota bacterium]